MLFDKLWAQVKGAERSGKLTVEEALDCATRLPQALFCSMMECLAENGEHPDALVVQIARLQNHMLKRLREVAAALGQRTRHGLPHTATAQDLRWTSGQLVPGGSFTIRMTNPGIYGYFCGDHPFMQATVIVTP